MQVLVAGLTIALATTGFVSSASAQQASDSDTASTQTYTREITIRPGDTLSHIAQREMGNANAAERLANYNGLAISKILRPGDTLEIPVSLPIREEFANVIFTKGDVKLNGDPVQLDDEVRLNDSIETGKTGYVSLAFVTGTLINLQPNTVARLITLHCQRGDELCVIEMAADKGTLSTDVRRDGDQPTDFRIRTPYASAAVRGTKFDVEADGTGLRVGVTEGNVNLVASGSDQEVALDIGFGSASAATGPLGSPIDLLPAPVFRFVPPRIAVGDTLRWFGLTDTPAYTLQIATAPSGVGVATDARVGSDLYSLTDTIPVGDYSLLLRAVDPNGLLGFPAVTPITVAAIDEALPEVVTSITIENGTYIIEVVDPPQDTPGFEIQVASDANFSDPLSVDVDNSGISRLRLPGDTLFARARILIDRTTVGRFGDITTLNED